MEVKVYCGNVAFFSLCFGGNRVLLSKMIQIKGLGLLLLDIFSLTFFFFWDCVHCREGDACALFQRLALDFAWAWLCRSHRRGMFCVPSGSSCLFRQGMNSENGSFEEKTPLKMSHSAPSSESGQTWVDSPFSTLFPPLSLCVFLFFFCLKK